MVRKLAIMILMLGVIGIAMGGAFVGLGIARNAELREAMRVEHITLGIEEAERGQVIDSFAEAKEAGDTIREHRRGIAPTYEDLLGGGRFDPTQPEQLTYAQALNLENYLYLAVTAFGLIQAVIAIGVFMIITGAAFGGTGLALLKLAKTP